MVDIGNSVLSPASRTQLNALRQTRAGIDAASLRLSTGRDVNNVFDDPQSFFASQSLFNQANDLSRVRQGIVQSRRAVEIAISANAALEDLLIQAQSIATTTQEELVAGEPLSFLDEEIVPLSTQTLSNIIQEDSPVAYYRLNETAGTTAIEATGTAGTFDGTYQSGVVLDAAPLYENGASASAEFDGVNDRVIVPNSTLINDGAQPVRSVELVFNADDTSGRQVLYEEGGGINGFTIYVDDGLLRITGGDESGSNTFDLIDFNAPIEAGTTYHAAFVFDRSDQTFTGYLDGEEIGQITVADEDFPSHTGGIGIGRNNGAFQTHDGDEGGSFNGAFNGRISDVAIYNAALTQEDFQERVQSLDNQFVTRIVNTEFEEVRSQIDTLVADATFRGVNLLNGDDLSTEFNAAGSTGLDINGRDFSFAGLDLERFDFDDAQDVSGVLDSIRSALRQVRSYARELTTGLSVLDVRDLFTRDTENIFRAAGDDLVETNQNEQAARLLALNTRQQVQLAVIAQGANGPSLNDLFV